MPTLTTVKPKINQAAKKSSGSPTPCDDCGTTASRPLIETYVLSTKEGGDEDGDKEVTRKHLCGACLVGHDAAVLRASDNSWCFGEVKEYDPDQCRPFLMYFLDTDSEEWVQITRTPSVDFLKAVGISQDQKESSSLMYQGSIGSFSSSSFSSERTSQVLNSQNTLPLFDDLKLIDPKRSEESLFSEDDEGNIQVKFRTKQAKETSTLSTPKESNQGNNNEDDLDSRVLNSQDTFPLYDDSKLIHLQRTDSFSSVEESLFSEDDNGNIQVKYQTTQALSTPKKSNQGEKKKSKTRSPVMWTREEDQNLVSIVDSFNEKKLQLKWTDVAAAMSSNRNGKQCRERYVNHLSSTLKGVWSPEEDVTVFMSFFRLGTKWCKISKLLRGRTDNGIKNRFHQLRRRLNKDVVHKSQKYSDDSDLESAKSMEGDSKKAIEDKTRKVLKVLADETKGNSHPHIRGYVFGPFVSVNDHKMCNRCGLFIPSAQTGETMVSYKRVRVGQY